MRATRRAKRDARHAQDSGAQGEWRGGRGWKLVVHGGAVVGGIVGVVRGDGENGKGEGVDSVERVEGVEDHARDHAQGGVGGMDGDVKVEGVDDGGKGDGRGKGEGT